MKIQAFVILLPLLFTLSLWSATPVPYSGKLDISGVNYFGEAEFAFSLHDGNGATHWRNGNQPGETIKVTIRNGRYNVLLGGQGMNSLPPELFLNHDKLYLKVEVDMEDGEGLRHLAPDQLITATPRALVAEWAKMAKLAEGVPARSITRDMLSQQVLTQLDANGSSASVGPITRDMLPASVLNDLNKTIVITRNMLPEDVRNDLNQSIVITRDMLPQDVQDDLNHSISAGSISLDMLAPEVRSDLNRTITKSMLGSDLLSDLNSSISLNRLSPEVLAALQVIPSISTEPFARYDWRTDSATIEARGRGHNLSYQWLKNGQVISGANAPVLELSNPVLDDNASYSVQLTNSVGQTASQTISLQQAIGAPGLPLEEANATQVPRNGLVLWLDANDLDADGFADNVLNGASIDSWTDKVSEKNATQSDPTKLPVYSKDGLIFDVNDFLHISDFNVTSHNLFIVAKSNSNSGQLLDLSDSKVRISTNSFKSDWNDYIGSQRISQQDQTFGMLSLKGIPFLATLAPNASKNLNSINIGQFGSLGGMIMEIILYDRALPTPERDRIENYLMMKWNLPTLEEASPQSPEEGLKAYFKFDSDNLHPNKIWDHSGNDNYLSMENFDGDPWVDGVIGQAISFDGVNDKCTGSRWVFGFNFKTISFWAKSNIPVDGRNDPHYFFYAGGGQKNFAFNKSPLGGSGHFSLSNEAGTSFVETNASNNLSINGWFYLTLVATESDGIPSYDIYLNGSRLETITTTTNIGFLDGSHSGLNIGNNRFSKYYKGSIDEFKIYDRLLAPAEIEALYNSYQNPIIRTSGERNATVGTNFSLSLAADNGPTTYLAEGLPAGLSLNTTTGQITGSLSQPGYHRVFVKAMNEHGTGSDTITIIARPQTDQYGWPVDVPDGSTIPQNGLVLWLDANDIDADGEFDTSTDHLKLSNWSDKAGMDHNATQATVANQPEIRSGQLTAKPNLNVLVFDGNQSLSFPGISQGRTFFWVLQRHAQSDMNANFFGENGDLLWGSNRNASYNYVISNTSSSQISNGSWMKNGSPSDNSFSESPLVVSLVTTGMASSNLIGKLGRYDNYFSGNIGEILVYDRALSTNEIETVEKYLGQKWGISISHSTTPSPSGNPPTFTVTPANDTVTTAHLTDQILKYLKPEITAQPQAQTIYADSNASFSFTAEGKYLSYQWKKDDSNLTGETNATLTITDTNATLHDGNYSVVVSNDFGSVESGMVEVKVNTWKPTDLNNLYIWYDASTSTNVTVVNDYVTNWHDLSGNDRNATRFDQGGPEISPEWNSTTLNNLGGLTFFKNSQKQRINFVETSFHQKSISLVLNTSSQSGGAIISHKNSNRGIGFSSENKISFFGDPAPYGGISFPQVINSEFNILTINFENNVSCWLNNHPNGIHIGTADVTDKKFNQIGALYGGSNSLSGSISEVIITNSVLDSQERSLLVRYLANKWGLIHKL